MKPVLRATLLLLAAGVLVFGMKSGPGDRQKVKRGLCGNIDQEPGYINADEAKKKSLLLIGHLGSC
jgi:hypothetical protein